MEPVQRSLKSERAVVTIQKINKNLASLQGKIMSYITILTRNINIRSSLQWVGVVVQCGMAVGVDRIVIVLMA